MRKLLLVPLLSLAAACAAIPAVLETAVSLATPAAAVSDKVVLEGTRGLVLAHNAYQGAEAIVAPLIRARVLTPAQVDRVEAINNEAERLFSQAHDVKSASTNAAKIFNLANELNKLAGK